MTAQQAALTCAIEDAETWVHSSSRLGRFWVSRIARQRIADWRRRLRSVAEPGQPFASVFRAAGHPGVEEWVGAGVRRWHDMILTMHAIAHMRGVDSLFVLQPVPEQGKPLTVHERDGLEAYPDMVVLRKRAYPRLQEVVRQLAARGIDSLDFGSIFASVAETIYTDHIHFEDRGCAIVARQLARHIGATWKCLE
jgi:hypothetical protein